MRVAEYKQIHTNQTECTITVEDFDENGKIIGSHEETVVKEIPVMGLVYRDMTPEEIAELEQVEVSFPEPSPEERLAALEEQNAMLVECLLEMSEIVYS